MKRVPIACLLALFPHALASCTAQSWKCDACLRDDAKTCGSSGAIGHATESIARCSAAESVCIGFDQATFDRRCKDQITTIQRECTAALLEQFELRCSSQTRYVLPGGLK